jgi:UDP-N-acetyl-alpha-D-muramoyl-L-alanyl-L-glutamate epimerase
MTPAAPAFAPGSVRAFTVGARTADWRTGVVRLGYALDDLPFTETFTFPVPDLPPPAGARADALDSAVELLHLVAGVSYYKAAVPPRIAVEGDAPPPALARALERLWTGGLGEFAWENRLPRVGHDISIPSGPERSPAPPLGLARRSLVPVGGGKDSVVSLAALARAGEDVVAFSVGRKPSADAAARIEGVPILHVDRQLDPALFALNRAGAYNGHVPITAIVSCAAVVAAVLHDCDAVVMSNERSASAGNVDWPQFGGVVNHQHSKGWDAERDLAAVVRERVAADLAYFSLLRPWSELAIARAFAALPEHHATVMSCNAGFTIHRPGRQGWCGDCPKCRFVFLALAPFAGRDAVIGVLGADLLDDPAQERGFREILGLDAQKPFECVGEVGEARAALRVLAADPAWARARVVAALADAVGGPEAGAAAPWLPRSGPHSIPERHLRAAGALLGP